MRERIEAGGFLRAYSRAMTLAAIAGLAGATTRRSGWPGWLSGCTPLRLGSAAVPVALLPGSRVSELELHADLVIETARELLKKRPEMHFFVPLATRETRDYFEQRLYALEANSFGQTWHISSDPHKRYIAQTGIALDYYSQFGALDALAEELVRRVRAEAC